jgi:hypothetical protein
MKVTALFYTICARQIRSNTEKCTDNNGFNFYTEQNLLFPALLATYVQDFTVIIRAHQLPHFQQPGTAEGQHVVSYLL